MTKNKAVLVLEDGTSFVGQPLGARGETLGEVVFHTAMTGYQEILTDPSYHRQIVTMTYPHIGNTGVNTEDGESAKTHVAGFIVKTHCQRPSNWRTTQNLETYLTKQNIIGIHNIDTRSLTRHLRDVGSKMGVISTETTDVQLLLDKVRRVPSIAGQDLVQYVTCKETHRFNESLPSRWYSSFPLPKRKTTKRLKVVAIDCGVKRNMLRWLVTLGCEVQVVPARTAARDILALQPDGVLVSNGPGDPEPLQYVIETLRGIMPKRPMFGICLGHQLLGLALGAKTYKLKFGHHGANHPIKHLSTGKVAITSQNHSFAVDPKSLPKDVEITHMNLNDQTVAGLRHTRYPLFAVQYHPEAAPGPHDAGDLFAAFMESMETFSP